MAKNLKAGQTVESPYGDTWNAAILVCDILTLNYLEQVMNVRVDVYKDTQARTDRENAMQRYHPVDKATFLSDFDINAPATQLKGQAEDWALTITDDDDNLIYGDTFE